MAEKVVIILGSSRSKGDTAQLVQGIAQQTNWPIVDLNDYQISYYDYEHRNRTDDFLPLMRDLLFNYDTLVFATPVYWYAMSGILKVFFDRITDLLKIEKPLGRQFRGKSMAVLSCSNGDHLGDNFWLPFRKSAEYLGMHYLTDLHTVVGEKKEEEMNKFITQILEK